MNNEEITTKITLVIQTIGSVCVFLAARFLTVKLSQQMSQVQQQYQTTDINMVRLQLNLLYDYALKLGTMVLGFGGFLLLSNKYSYYKMTMDIFGKFLIGAGVVAITITLLLMLI